MTTARAMTLRQVVLIVLGLAVLTALPLVLSPSLVNAAIKMLIAALFALAFSLAMGQAGMLSFGHSAYYGLGAFAGLHLMKAVEEHVLAWPTPLVPLVGATAGLLAGIVFGWFATQRTGVYFAMVTLALAELLFTLAPTWNSLFGGKSGISTMRMPSWAFSFGNDTHVYYLTLAWVALSAWCLWAFAGTPMGRLAVAMRENEHRLRFLGFNTHLARTLVFAISAMFTGVAGALLAIANEASNYTIFSAQASANVVLQTFIGGAGTFLGPALGAAVMTFFARVTSDLTRSWLLYQGLIFVLVMLFVRRDRRASLDACAPTARRCDQASRPALSAVRRGRPPDHRGRRVHGRERLCAAVRCIFRTTACCRRRRRALPAVKMEIRSIVAADVELVGGALIHRRRAPAVREAPDGIGMELGAR